MKWKGMAAGFRAAHSGLESHDVLDGSQMSINLPTTHWRSLCGAPAPCNSTDLAWGLVGGSQRGIGTGEDFGTVQQGCRGVQFA